MTDILHTATWLLGCSKKPKFTDCTLRRHLGTTIEQDALATAATLSEGCRKKPSVGNRLSERPQWGSTKL